MSFKGNLLSVENVRRSFGGVHAVDGVSFQVREGSITGLIGPNGAGKTTMVNLISGSERMDGGSIRFRGKELSGMPVHQIAQMGMVRTFQISRELQKLTVLENMLLSPQNQYGEKSWAALFSRKKDFR